jgi:hypothetical protein
MEGEDGFVDAFLVGFDLNFERLGLTVGTAGGPGLESALGAREGRRGA